MMIQKYEVDGPWASLLSFKAPLMILIHITSCESVHSNGKKK